VGAPLTVVPELGAYEGGASLALGLAGAHQRVNAALAVALAAAWEAQHAQHARASGHAAAVARERAEAVAQLRLPEAYRKGLQACYWPGRAEASRRCCTCWRLLTGVCLPEYHASCPVLALRYTQSSQP
jgi:folylpolyglutamate synthase